MDGLVGSLRLGWQALLLREEAYERMRAAASPVVKGLIFILVVGLAVALLGFIGDVLEWATTPDLLAIKDTVYEYLTQMFWWEMAENASPQFPQEFQRWYDWGWDIGLLLGGPNLGYAASNIIFTPLGLVLRWLIYGLLAYVFARWLGGTADLSQTLGVLALAAAPQMLRVLTILPYVGVGSLVAIWGVLCAYVGLKTAHNLPWHRAVWATILPFLLAVGILLFAACVGSAVLAVAIRGGS
ncbi:MAG TPA: Yip1 family protein [Anaerolineae bacterium]|nr:Yip1 family protein [Anaerolineae bacterium]